MAVSHGCHPREYQNQDPFNPPSESEDPEYSNLKSGPTSSWVRRLPQTLLTPTQPLLSLGLEKTFSLPLDVSRADGPFRLHVLHPIAELGGLLQVQQLPLLQEPPLRTQTDPDRSRLHRLIRDGRWMENPSCPIGPIFLAQKHEWCCFWKDTKLWGSAPGDCSRSSSASISFA